MRDVKEKQKVNIRLELKGAFYRHLQEFMYKGI